MIGKTPSGAKRKYWTRKLPNRLNVFLSFFYLFFSQLFKQASSNCVTLSWQFLHKAASYSGQYMTTSLFHNFEVSQDTWNHAPTWELWLYLGHRFHVLYTCAKTLTFTNFWTRKLNGFCWTLCKRFHFCSVLWTVDDNTNNSLHIFFMY